MALHGFLEFFQKEKTFRPKKKFEPGTLRYGLHKAAQASLSSGINLAQAVKLPPGEDLNDWIAVHVVDFFNRINLIYGTVCDYCTDKTCPTMSGGPKFEYLWADGNTPEYKKPTQLPANKYINLLMDWIENQINSEAVFPTRTDQPFPKNFQGICKKILTRLFRVFVHVYIHHFDRIVALGAEAHVNTCYKHFYYFVMEFHLINAKELEPLKEMTLRICPPPQQPQQQQHHHHQQQQHHQMHNQMQQMQHHQQYHHQSSSSNNGNHSNNISFSSNNPSSTMNSSTGTMLVVTSTTTTNNSSSSNSAVLNNSSSSNGGS